MSETNTETGTAQVASVFGGTVTTKSAERNGDEKVIATLLDAVKNIQRGQSLAGAERIHDAYFMHCENHDLMPEFDR